MHNKIKNLFGSDFGNKIFITIENTISEHNMKEKIESGVLVGFSGGPDSMMLLAFLVEYRDRYNSFPIVLSHINHCIRGVEADRDEHFSIEIANALQVPILTKRIDILDEIIGLGLRYVWCEPYLVCMFRGWLFLSAGKGGQQCYAAEKYVSHHFHLI